MKHKTWFRLVLKAIGVLLIGFSLQGVIPAIAAVVMYLLEWSEMSVSSNEFMWWNFPYYIAGFVQFGLGIYLFFGGKWIVNKAIPSNRSYCPECGYQIANAHGANCPECGVALPREQGGQSQTKIEP